jgi:hypothetical protein
MSIDLQFGDAVPDATRRRMSYAAKTFAAVYGYEWDPGGARVRLCYGAEPSRATDVPLTASYRPRVMGAGPAAQYHNDALFLDNEAESFPCLHPAPYGVDWLGEIFEWIGGEAEHTTRAADELGAVPYADTLPGRFRLDPEVPWAALAMRGLNQEIRSTVPGWPEGAAIDGKPIVVATHDLDFLPVSTVASVQRGLKNFLVAVFIYRSPRLALRILRNMGRFDDFEGIVRRERDEGVQASVFVMTAKTHRRDANYRLDDPEVLRLLHKLLDAGLDIGVHGSYDSLFGGSLQNEYERLRRVGFEPLGGRQHWLRYRPQELFAQLVRAGALYDCSVGYNDQPGFRAGASFAFVPYDFANEQPFPLLEFPTVVMDATLFRLHGFDIDAAKSHVDRILRRARLYSPGSVAVVWHNTAFGGGQLPRAIGDLYWALRRPGTDWVSGKNAAMALWPSFASAGLIPYRS